MGTLRWKTIQIKIVLESGSSYSASVYSVVISYIKKIIYAHVTLIVKSKAASDY